MAVNAFKTPTREAFYYRVFCGPELSEEQFKTLCADYLRLQSNGILCELYADWTSDKGWFWDSQSWTLHYSSPITPGMVKDGLLHFAKRGIAEKGWNPDGKPLDAFITLKMVTAKY